MNNIKITILLFVVWLSICGNEALFQVEVKGAYVSVDPHMYIDTNGRNGFYITTDICAANSYSEKLSFIINQHFRGYGSEPVLPEIQIPIESYFYSGLRISNSTNMFQAGAANYLYPQSEPLSVPNLPQGSFYEPGMLNAIDLSWKSETDLIQFSTSGNYFVNSFTIFPDELYYDPYHTDNPPFGKANDADLWMDAVAGVSVFGDITTKGSIRYKDDLNRSKSENVMECQIGLEGEHVDARKRIFFTWKFFEHFFKCDAFAAGRRYPSLFSVFAARTIIKIQPKLIFKGVFNSEFSSKVLKIQYEGAMRKQWKNGNSIDFVYYGTSGVLFPRQIVKIKTDVNICSHFGFAPRLMVAFGRVDAESGFRYYKSDYGIELFFPIVKRLEAFCDYDLSHFDNHPLFSSRNTVSAGIRTW